jgi:two-component system phosphate regulon response regulator PhoB
MSTVVLLIHYHELARIFIANVLEQQGGYVVLAASNGDEAVRVLNREQPPLVPDVIVVGNDDLRELLASPWRRQVPEGQRLPLVVLGDMGAALPARVVAVVPPEPRLLLLKLKALLRSQPSCEESLERQGLRLDPASQEAMAGHLRLNLTPLSFRLLHFLMKNPGRVYSREQLLDHVWRDQGYVEERTVDVHVYRLRNQLDRYGYGHLIEAVRGSGYRFATETPRQEQPSGAGLRFAS